MSDSSLVFALLSGASAAAYTICTRLAAGGIGASLGAMLVAAVALLVNLGVTLALRRRGVPVPVTPAGVYWAIAAGLAAAGIDLFGFLAYARGLRVSSSPLMTGTALAIVLVVGVLVFREALGWPRLGAVALIAAGIWLLQRAGV
jgi:drug/metabolite transporter (DMT)-like permease